jgi:hypothetical protein
VRSAGECEQCHLKRVQDAGRAVGVPEVTAPLIVRGLLRAPGQLLGRCVNADKERRFGHEFGRVNVHANEQAPKSANALERADTLSGASEHWSDSLASDRRLAYVVQQNRSGTRVSPLDPRVGDTERAAHRVIGAAGLIDERGNATSAGAPQPMFRATDALADAVGPEGYVSEPETEALKALEQQATADAEAGAKVPAKALPCADQGFPREVPLQPVFFVDVPYISGSISLPDLFNTGQTWEGRLVEARALWGKLGVTFKVSNPVTVTSQLKTRGESPLQYPAIRKTYSGAGVEVFMMDNDVASDGGGVSQGNENVILSDRGTSDTLLAHELGHILGLHHPNGGLGAGTLMEPSKSNNKDNPKKVTMDNYSLMTWPTASLELVCLSPHPKP